MYMATIFINSLKIYASSNTDKNLKFIILKKEISMMSWIINRYLIKYISRKGPVAQRIEQFPSKEEVAGSIPAWVT